MSDEVTDSEQYAMDKQRMAVGIFKRKRSALDKAADELVVQLNTRGVAVHKATAILCLASSIAVYEIEGGR